MSHDMYIKLCNLFGGYFVSVSDDWHFYHHETHWAVGLQPMGPFLLYCGEWACTQCDPQYFKRKWSRALVIWTLRIRKNIQLQPRNDPVPLRHPGLHDQMVVWILMCYQYGVSDIRWIIYGLDMSITLYAILWWFMGVSWIHFIDFYTYSKSTVRDFPISNVLARRYVLSHSENHESRI